MAAQHKAGWRGREWRRPALRLLDGDGLPLRPLGERIALLSTARGRAISSYATATISRQAMPPWLSEC